LGTGAKLGGFVAGSQLASAAATPTAAAPATALETLPPTPSRVPFPSTGLEPARVPSGPLTFPGLNDAPNYTLSPAAWERVLADPNRLQFPGLTPRPTYDLGLDTLLSDRGLR